MSSERETFMRMMGITADDVVDPNAVRRTPTGTHKKAFLAGAASPAAAPPRAPSPPARKEPSGATMSSSPAANLLDRQSTKGSDAEALAAKRRAFLAELGLDDQGMPAESLATTRPRPSRLLDSPPRTTLVSSAGCEGIARSVRPAQPAGSAVQSSVERLKQAGNTAFEDGHFLEAIRFYTEAIEVGLASHTDAVVVAALFSNRSAAYLQGAKALPSCESAYDHALCDAEQTVALRPDWFKGYSRQGDACFKSQRYHQAVEAYEMALHLEPDNTNLARSLKESRERAVADSREQWQARRQARKQLRLSPQQSLRNSDSTASQSAAHTIVAASPSSTVTSVGYEHRSGVATAAPVTDLNGWHDNDSTRKSSLERRPLQSHPAAAPATSLSGSTEPPSGDDYRKQQLEKFRREREEKAQLLFGAGARATPLHTDRGDQERIHNEDSSVRGPRATEREQLPSASEGSRAAVDHSHAAPTVTSSVRVGSQSIPTEFSSSAAAAYQQRLIEEFRLRKSRA